ncbi:TadE family protein [Streptomyces sp. NPDC058001]|uniref:TadE family protein n=1 Tax=Streptomyces sp. NPDC058001 TaxID=3346300 RepID=UPI0036EC4CD1
MRGLRSLRSPVRGERSLLRRLARRRPSGDRGVSILEFVGFLPILLFIGLATIQLGLVGYAVSQAGSGARAAARVQSQGEDGTAAGLAAMDGRLTADVNPGGGPGTGDTTTATVTVQVPLLLPFVGSGWEVERSVTMPNDRRE